MEWKTSKELVEYQDAIDEMERIVSAIHKDNREDCVWLLEHPPVYTAGTSAKAEDMLDPRFPVYYTGRGGQYTYHGPGQRIGYVMMDLKKRQAQPDIRKYVWSLEEWIIRTLEKFDVKGERREGRVGIWVKDRKGEEKKAAAIGVRIRHWITFHGIAINVNPDLSHFDGIVPCGVRQYGTTSLKQLIDQDVSMEYIDEALKYSWDEVFEVPERKSA